MWTQEVLRVTMSGILYTGDRYMQVNLIVQILGMIFGKLFSDHYTQA